MQRPRGLRYWVLPLVGAAVGVLAAGRAGDALGISAAIAQPRGIPPTAFTLICLSAGGAGGFLVALSMPLARWLGGAFLVSTLGLFPIVLVAELVTRRHHPMRVHLATAAVVALIIGGFVGAGAWLDEDRHSYRLAHLWVFAALSAPAAWYLRDQWPGQWPAYVGLAVFFVPLGLAVTATVSAIDRKLR